MACIAWVSEGTSINLAGVLTAALTRAGHALLRVQTRIQIAKVVDNYRRFASERGSGHATTYHAADLAKGAMRRLK